MRCHPKGFSLIESAIVLAVVALVIGGVWAAASTVTENRRAAEATSGILRVLENVRKAYRGQPFDAPFNDNLEITEFMFEAGLMPADWGPADDNSAYINNFVYPNSRIGVYVVNDAGVESINLRVHGLNQKSCNRLIREVAARSGQEKGRLREIDIVSPDIAYIAPFDISTVNCPASFLRISMYFYR